MSEGKKPDKDSKYGSLAYRVADRLAEVHGLTYRCKVNLEAVANALISLGTTEDEAYNLLDDVVENLEFVDGDMKL